MVLVKYSINIFISPETVYGKCPKILHTKVSDKMTSKQSRPRSDCSYTSKLIWVNAVCHSTKYSKKQLHKKQTLCQKSIEESVQNFRTFTILIGIAMQKVKVPTAEFSLEKKNDYILNCSLTQ